MAFVKKKSLKRKPDHASDGGGKKKAPLALQLDDDVPDFPRGGGSALSRREKDEIRAEVDAEFDNEEMQSNKKRRKEFTKKKSNKEAADDELGSLFGDVLSGKLPRFANKITLKNICPGMKLWGVISEVNEKDLVVSLPGGLRGLVRANEAVDTALIDSIKENGENYVLSSLFEVGQLVSSVVLQVEDDKKTSKRKVWLSLRLSLLHKGLSFDAVQEGMALTAYVKSIEDHGYILHFGVSSFTGFLPKKNMEGNREIKVNNGQLLRGIIKSTDKVRKVVHMCCDTDVVAKCVTKDLKGISLDLLVPGMMVNARVQATLENGIMLSFLTYFTGTVDVFHLSEMLPSSAWKKKYEKNKNVAARILFIDPSTRAVGLTMNQYLILNKAPHMPASVGDVYDHSKIIRVDRGVGLLLEIPSIPVSAPAYVNIQDAADGKVGQLDKKFKEGSHVRARILGFKHLEGLAMGVLKASAFESALFTHSDVKPGIVVKAKLLSVSNSGAILQLSSGVKALCPLQHMSEFYITKPRKKFKVGAELLFRVLGCKSKRITVTHKKTLVKSKLFVLASYADATDGLVTHGWISNIEKHGCFLKFYNGVQGFAPRAELGLEAGCDISSMYHVGQVVKCRVTSSVPAHHRITLSFIISPRVSGDEVVKLGSLVSGVVEDVTSRCVLLHVKSKGNMKGTIQNEHLADHQNNAASLKSVLKKGDEFSELVVLDIEGNNLILSAKYSLVHAIEQLPVAASQIHPHSVIHGYVCNLIDTGCFVRFLGNLTAFSPRRKAVDDQSVDLSNAFYIGQSVRSDVLDVDNDTGRITVSLKQSSCASTDGSFLQSYFLSKDKIAKFQVSDSIGSEFSWFENFGVGSIVDCNIREIKEFGVIVGFDMCPDVAGFISQSQLSGCTVKMGTTVQAAVLDVVKSERLVDLSLKPEFIKNPKDLHGSSTSRKKRKRDTCKELKELISAEATVEIVKDDYLVLSLPEHNNAIGYAAVTDYNTQKLSRKQFLNGERVKATIMSLPSDLTDGRLLLLLDSTRITSETSSSKKEKKKSSYDIGSLVQAEIIEVKLLELSVKFGVGFRGRIHITEVNDDNHIENPLADYKMGQTVTAKIVGKPDHAGSDKKGKQWDLSVKPSVLSGSNGVQEKLRPEVSDFSAGQQISGYICKVDNEWIWLMISHQVRAQIFILDSANQPKDLKQFQKRFKVGQSLSGYIVSVNKEKKLLRLSLREISDSKEHPETHDLHKILAERGASHIHEGDVVGGRITKMLPGVGGILVQIGPHLYGKVHYTEIKDDWVSDPLSGFQEGQFVKCKVLEIGQSVTGSVHVDLSLRNSLEGMGSRTSKPGSEGSYSKYRMDKSEDLHPNMSVQGYVKNVTAKGCFVTLSRNIDAKILLGNLSDGYVEDPPKKFPVGTLVSGKVLSVDPSSHRVEVTLKSSDSSNKAKFNSITELSCLSVGDVISGKVKRVESFGLFIMIENTNLDGLCHISEIADDRVDNIETIYKTGERVTAKVLKIDMERQRISLGMKPSYMVEDNSKVADANGSVGDMPLVSNTDSHMASISDSDNEADMDGLGIVPGESGNSVPPLEVNLEDIEEDEDGANGRVEEEADDAADKTTDEKKSIRKGKKKAREEREQEIRAAEERLLKEDKPRTTNDFEKLVRRSPNSSFIWIQYMAMMLSLADVEGAREVARRALKTINMTHETEKLNVWVAYLNLENEYGNPPEEAVTKVFNEALQICDPLKLHLELLGLYERTKQNKLADELLEKMMKKFKNSPEVWLRRIQWLLMQNQDGVEAVITRALMSLPRHQKTHISFLTQVALLEFKCGSPDKARSLFEKVLRENPKRIDLWSVYLDQEIKLGDMELIRALFERATSLSLPLKKMQFLFKKYIDYEDSHGDEERVRYVAQKAREYYDTVVEQ